jgi:hypothetical protein
MDLVEGKMYYLYGFAGCPLMESVTRRRFVGMNNGQPMFYNKKFGNVIYRIEQWYITQTPI